MTRLRRIGTISAWIIGVPVTLALMGGVMCLLWLIEQWI